MGITQAKSLKWLVVGAALLMLPRHLAAQERTTISTFPAISYYLGYAEFAAKTDGEIRIAAAGKYALYLNGDLVGTDDDPTTVETWEASFKRRANTIAVAVEYSGLRPEYGFFPGDRCRGRAVRQFAHGSHHAVVLDGFPAAQRRRSRLDRDQAEQTGPTRGGRSGGEVVALPSPAVSTRAISPNLPTSI